MTGYRSFYERIDRVKIYTPGDDAEEHLVYKDLIKCIEIFHLNDKKCLEIGSGKGLFQDIVHDYTGLDIAISLSKYYRKPYVIVNEDGTYPFKDNTFDAIWTHAVHEHIPELNKALGELKRVMKSDGVVFFSPAWQCRPWAAEGYAVRPYSELNLRGKVIKALIPLREPLWWRSLFIFPKRFFRHCLFLLGKRYSRILFKKLKPNYEHHYVSDSDACNCIDPHDAILWFESNGFQCVSHPLHLKAFFVRTGPLIFKKVCSHS